MKTFLMLIVFTFLYQFNLSAQKDKKSEFKIDLGIGPAFSLGWNAYSWY
jgi:hypothetical protein